MRLRVHLLVVDSFVVGQVCVRMCLVICACVGVITAQVSDKPLPCFVRMRIWKRSRSSQGAAGRALVRKPKKLEISKQAMKKAAPSSMDQNDFELQWVFNSLSDYGNNAGLMWDSSNVHGGGTGTSGKPHFCTVWVRTE